jgi:hypothetical protein
MDVPSQSRMDPARMGPAGGATVRIPGGMQGYGLACGSRSRDSRRTLHAGRRDGSGRVERKAAHDVESRAACRDLDGECRTNPVRGPSSRGNHRAFSE